MKKFYFILSALLFIQQLATAQTYKRAWIYNDSLPFFPSIFFTNSATDIHGNTYICYPGSVLNDNQGHFTISKINTLGELAWQSIYGNAAHPISGKYPTTTATDTSGNLYIALGSVNLDSATIIKYDAAGNFVWTKAYAEQTYYGIFSILVKPDNSVIIFTNTNTKGKPDEHLIIHKINPDGTTVYANSINIIHGHEGVSACLDKKGNIIVAQGGRNAREFLGNKSLPTLSKFDAKGNFLFTDSLTDQSRVGFFVSASTDSVGNIYAFGETYTKYNHQPGDPNQLDSTRLVTVKYNSAGRQVWFKPQESGISVDSAANLLVNKSGDSWLTKLFNGHWQTKAYNNAGKQLWTATLPDTGKYYKPYGMLQDGDSNVFVNGYATYGTNKTAAVIAGYNKNGGKIYFDTVQRLKASNFDPYMTQPYLYTFGFNKDANNDLYSVNLQTDTVNIYKVSFLIIKYRKKVSQFIQTQKAVTANNLSLYPNPVVNNISIDFTSSSSSKNYKLIISDVSGNVVLIKQLNNTDKILHINVDVSNLKTGVYTANITDGINAVSQTFLKQ